MTRKFFKLIGSIFHYDEFGTWEPSCAPSPPKKLAVHVQGGMPADLKTSDALRKLIEAAKIKLASMSPDEQQAMWAAQRESWVRGEMQLDRTADRGIPPVDQRDAADELRLTKTGLKIAMTKIAAYENRIAELEGGPPSQHAAGPTDDTKLLEQLMETTAVFTLDGDEDACVICGEHLEEGDPVYWSSNDDGHMHADCATSYVDEDGNETDEPPEPFRFRPDHAAVPPVAETAPIETRNEEAGFVEFVNDDRPYIVRDIPAPAAVLVDMETRHVIGYRIYDPEGIPPVHHVELVEDLRLAASSIRQWMPETLPANEQGQIHFARLLAESAAEAIEAYLAALKSEGSADGR